MKSGLNTDFAYHNKRENNTTVEPDTLAFACNSEAER